MSNNTMVYNLEVNGSTKIIGDIRFSGDLYKNNVLFTGGSDWIKDIHPTHGTQLYYTAGKVGIGNNNPMYSLAVGNSSLSGSDGKIYIGKNNGSGGSRYFTIKYNSAFDMCFCDNDDKDVFKVNHNAPANSLVVKSNGLVGIGTDNATELLTVAGTIRAFGDVNVKGGAAGHSISCKGAISDGLTNSGRMGLYIRHDNDTQGISIGYAGIIANGTSNHGITITSRGTFTTFNGTGVSSNATYTFFSINQSSNLANQYTNFNVVTKHNGAIWSTNNFVASSDRDIKTNIEELVDSECLEKILLLKPSKYNYIDKRKNGLNKVYGYIAQDVKEVFPESVRYESEYIPNGYVMCDVSNGIFSINEKPLTYSLILEVEKKIKLYNESDEEVKAEITEVIDENTFKIDIETDKEKLFLYGSLKEDFNVLNKEYINAVHVSATQELHRIIMRQQTVIDSLISRIEILET
jgi:hypothetical protein